MKFKNTKRFQELLFKNAMNVEEFYRKDEVDSRMILVATYLLYAYEQETKGISKNELENIKIEMEKECKKEPVI